MRRTLFCGSRYLWAICLIVPALTFGQEQVGSRLFGTVTDPSSRPIPGAEVKVVSTETGAQRIVLTGPQGNYLVPQINAGTYEILISKTGFSVARVAEVIVRTNESVRRNVALELGTVTTTVVVSAAAELTNTYTAQLSQTVDERRVRDLPLNGRDVSQLALTVPGATVTDVSTGFYQGTSGFGTTSAVVNGNHSQDNVYMLDGMNNMYMARRVSNAYPNPDAVEEFTLNTAQFTAEMGGLPGGQLSVRTKGGTNELHGSLFEFVRNGSLNARNAFDRTGTHDGLKRHQYGWAVGGPVYIPKFIDGRNKLFWFNSYQKTSVRQPGRPGFHESWTVQEKMGDFSEHFRGNTKQVPATACDGTMLTVDTGTIFDPLTANSACAAPGIPFEGNIIPRSRLDPVMETFLQQHTPDAPYLGFKIAHFIPNKSDAYQWVNKFDYIAGSHQIMGRYLYSNRSGDSFNDPTDLLWQIGINEGGNTTEAKQLAITDTWAVSPTFLVTGGFGYMQNPFATNPHPFRTSWSQLGSRIQNDEGCQDLNFSVAGRQGLRSGGTVRIWDRCSVRDTHSWELNNAVKWIRGNHEISIGGSYSKHHGDSTAQLQSGGGFLFGGQFTGLGVADAALGLAQRYNVGSFGTATGAERLLAALYFQDNYRVTQRLTLNLGVRWDPGFTARDKNGFQSWIQEGKQSQRFPNAPLGILYHGDPGTPDASMYTRWNQIAPRLGLAYDPTGTGTWSIRAGVGSYFGMMMAGGHALSGAGGGFPPFPTGSVTVINPPNLTFPWDAPPYNGEVGIPIPAPTAESPVRTPIAGWAQDPNSKMPNTWNWSLTVERDMGGNTILRGSYVGTRGTHLIGGEEFNLPVFIPGASTPGNEQQRRPDPNFGPTNITSSSNDSHYHSFQFTAEKRYSHNLTFLANYTLSKSIDGSSNAIGWAGGYGVQDPRGPWFNRGLSEFDRTHVVNGSLVWDTPRLEGRNPVLRTLVRNWELSSILAFRSGNPISIVSSKGNSLSLGKSTPDRADVVPGVDWRVTGRSRHEIINVGYFNQAAFTDAAIGTRGNAGRSIIRLAGFANTDFMLARIIPIGERVRLQVRSEFFNVFNRVNMKSPRPRGATAFADVNNPGSFGKYIVVGANDPRILQFGLKVLF